MTGYLLAAVRDDERPEDARQSERIKEVSVHLRLRWSRCEEMTQHVTGRKSQWDQTTSEWESVRLHHRSSVWWNTDHQTDQNFGGLVRYDLVIKTEPPPNPSTSYNNFNQRCFLSFYPALVWSRWLHVCAVGGRGDGSSTLYSVYRVLLWSFYSDIQDSQMENPLFH